MPGDGGFIYVECQLLDVGGWREGNMKIDFTPVAAAFGIGLATILLLRLRKTSPDVLFKDVRYNKLRNEIQLVVENVSGKTVYVRPALRLVKLLHADELRERSSNGPIPMMTASAGSVIKGYDLIGEYAVPVGVDANSQATITYPVMRDFGLKAYDNIRVDSPVGESPERLEGSVCGTVRMNLSDFFSDEYADELLQLFDGHLKTGVQAQVSLDGCLIPAPKPSGSLKADCSVEALCWCCGKKKRLEWVVDGRHVCLDCRDYLGGAPSTLASEHEIGDPSDEAEERGAELELVESPSGLKPRHRKILEALNLESTMSAKELSGRLGRDQKSVATDLRFLMRTSLVDRVKIRGQYKYYMIRDCEKVLIRTGGGEPGDGFDPTKGAA